MTAKRQKVTKGREKLSHKEQLVPGYPRYTPETHSVTSQASFHPETDTTKTICMLKDQLN